MPLAIDGVDTRHLFAGDAAALGHLAADFRPDWILHAGSLSASAWDLPASDPAWPNELAVVSALLDVARTSGARLTVVLTDAVFTGPRMFHDESARTGSPHPAAPYALAIEQLLCDTIALVVRTHAYGWAPVGGEPALAERAYAGLAGGQLAKNAAAITDGRRYATPILASDLALLLDRARHLNLQGLLHVSGAERTSPYRLACELAAAAGLPLGTGLSGAVEPAETPEWLSETSLSSRRARRSLELPMPMLREGLQRFVEQAASGWRQRSRGANHAVLHGQAA